MSYADYSYYKDEFHGNIVSEESFDRNALQASQYIDNVTFGRASTASEGTFTAVKNACCALAEIYYSGTISPRATTGVATERAGEYSVSYAAAENVSTQQKKLRTAAKLWLGGTGLMYRGAYYDDKC